MQSMSAMPAGRGGIGLKPFLPPNIFGPLVAENLTTQDYSLLQQNNFMLKRMFRDRIYERTRYISGTAVPTTPLTLFSHTLGGSATVINSSATSYSVTQIDTNITQANQLPKGDIFICTSMQAHVFIPGALDTTITNGEALNPTPTGTPPAVVNTMRCLIYGGFLALNIGPTQYEMSPIWAFPAGPYAISGMAGAGISTTSTESFVQNGNNVPVQCKPWHVIDPGRNFNVKLTWIDAWTPQTLFYLTILLDGFRLTDVS